MVEFLTKHAWGSTALNVFFFFSVIVIFKFGRFPPLLSLKLMSIVDVNVGYNGLQI